MSVRNFVRKPIAAALLGIALGVPTGAVIALGQSDAAANPTASSVQNTPGNPRALLPDFAALVRQYGPAVVNITVKDTVRTSARGPGPQGPGAEEDPFAPFREMPRGQQPPMRGQGSGFIIEANGVILTNAHVVADASEVSVKLTDQREFNAKVIGLDPTSDVAVLKIEAQNLPTVKLGNPDKVAVGEWVVAIGSPFGFTNSVTQGIVSAKGRTLPDGSYVPFLQTDVAVNPGNSGGPLFNLAGEVVGINSQIFSRTGGYQGLSFAIPIDVAMNVSQQLQATGHVSRGRLGVSIQALDQSLAKTFGLEQPRGALIAAIEPGSPAAEAGLKSGDVILSFNGAQVLEASELPARVASLTPGSPATLGVWREGAASEVKVKLGEMSAPQTAVSDDGKAEAGRLGLAVRPLTQDEQREVETAGLLVEDVTGASAEAGILPGDIVISANGQEIRSVEQLRTLADKAGEHMALLIQREGRRLFVPVEVG
ncbi:MAG: DegQ family serine endoprotease [Panacagrimonas sp.]